MGRDAHLKETRSTMITCKKILALLLVVSTVALSLPTITAVNLDKHSVATTTELDKETKSSPAPSTLSIIWYFPTNGSIHSSPAIGDVDGDGKPEAVVGSDNGNVYCIDGPPGNSNWIYKTSNRVESSPVIVDVDKDGHNEVIVGSDDHKVYCLNSYGKQKWNYTTRGAVISSPAIADLDGDGSLEVVIGSFDNNTYCLNYKGGLEWNRTTYGVLSSPAIADLNEDGRLEIVFGSWDGSVYCLNGTGKVQWIYTTGSIIYSSPNVADVDGNGHKEVIIGSCDKNIYCLNATGGLKWKYATGNAVRSSPTTSDIDNDNRTEIIVGSNDYNVYCLTGTGGLKWKSNMGSAVSCHPAVGDVDGDNWKEVVVGSWWCSVFCLNRYGLVRYSYNIGGTYTSDDAIVSSPATADINGDKKKEIVVGSQSNTIYCLSGPRVGTLIIIVHDISTGTAVQGANVFSIYEPDGQSSLFSITAWDGSATFMDIAPGSYYFGVNATGYSNTEQDVRVVANATTTFQFDIQNLNLGTSISIHVIIASIAISILSVILILRRLSGEGSGDRDIPTYPYEDASISERPSEVSEESDRTILSQQICPHCGATFMRPGASYCWNCGAGLAAEVDTSAVQGRKRELLATIGRCMVCGLDVKKGEGIARCPSCRNIAHRAHLLEWLHTRKYCPGCYHHLDEKDLGSN